MEFSVSVNEVNGQYKVIIKGFGIPGRIDHVGTPQEVAKWVNDYLERWLRDKKGRMPESKDTF